MFRGTGVSHNVKCSHAVHMGESQGFIQSANNNLAAVSLQCNLHFAIPAKHMAKNCFLEKAGFHQIFS